MGHSENRMFRSAGLCSTCDNAAYCGHRARRGFDAQYCESFDDSGGSTVPLAAGRHEIVTLTDRAGEGAPSEAPALKGLCLNCEIRETCMLPRPVEGVWHCEEYR